MYRLLDYAAMIEDAVRTPAYLAALEQAVRPGSVVVEIGTGTGFFAIIAARLGARRVYAIESDSSIRLAREVAALNGCADRIEFIEALSTDVTLPEQGDVLLSDLRGVLPTLGVHIPSIVDARARLLKPGGIQIPSEDTLWMALLESEAVAQKHLKNADPSPHGDDFAPLHPIPANTGRKQRVGAALRISAPARWAHLDYRTVIDPSVRGTATLAASRSGVVHGLSAWFETQLLPGIGYASEPGSDAIYGQAYFPFPVPLSVREGDEVEVSLDGRLVGSEYVWRWSARAVGVGMPSWSCDQSSFFGTPLGPEMLRRRASNFVPRVSAEGEIDGWILSRMDAVRDLATIAREALQEFPEKLKTFENALTRVGDLAERYSS